MKTFFTSDTHFFHDNIIKFCNRPYGSVEHMNAELILNWNMVVKDEDDVWFLGDFSFGREHETGEILNQLRGRKHLIVGNHDRKGRCERLFNKNWETYFQSKSNYLRLKMDKHALILCHFPFQSWERGHVNLHGHTHGTYASKWGQHDVGVDVNNYAPILLEDAVRRAYENKVQEGY